MKQIISYMANDGAVFDDYDDYVSYKRAEYIKAAKGQLRFMILLKNLEVH